MKKNFSPVLLLAAIPVIYLSAIYNQLPETVATHFSWEGNPDQFGSKSTLWLSTIVMSGIGIILWLLLTNINKIDSKRSSETRKTVLTKIAWISLAFLCLFAMLIIQSSSEGKMIYMKLGLPALGLLITLMGNYMPQIKQNYFAGFRTPWALKSEYNWKMTNQVAGKLFFWGGLVTIAGTLILPIAAAKILFISIMVVMGVASWVKSWLVFKEEKRKQTV
jgi:uncharacterized membrane protein